MPTPNEINAGHDALQEHCKAHGIWITGQIERKQIVSAILEAAEKARTDLYGMPINGETEQYRLRKE